MSNVKKKANKELMSMIRGASSYTRKAAKESGMLVHHRSAVFGSFKNGETVKQLSKRKVDHRYMMEYCR